MPTASHYSSGHSASSPNPTSSSGTTYGQQQLANVVKRLAIEGKAERGPDGPKDGASIKMYLKIALPLSGAVPGSTVTLFKEENLKILDSQVHPLDNDSVPYYFSTATSPLLRKAGRALSLSARSKESYMSLFGQPASSSSSPSSAPLDDRYTGYILVSGYHVSYVLPKEFPPRYSHSGSSSRKLASPELQFMAAIDMWAPFIAKPPHFPYLLSLPVPRCLSNHIRLRIFPPNVPNVSSSLASLSSMEGEPSTWDLTAEPHVTRTASRRLSRSNSYQNFADDDTSDSSPAGFADGYGIQGSFPSTERIRVRWAAPMKPSDVPETSDGRRRVGIREVKGDMVCAVLDRAYSKGKERGSADEGGDEGIVMKVDYTATCKGVWFPGVATMLGMDVSLDTKDCEVTWAPGTERKWTVTGGPGFTGIAVDSPPRAPKPSPADVPGTYDQPSPPKPQGQPSKPNGYLPHPSSSFSLMRAPLPSGIPDDSAYEDSPSLGNTPLSSIASIATAPSSPERKRSISRASSVVVHSESELTSSEVVRHPKVPISVHLNMNELVPQKGAFTLTISGVIMVIPHNDPFLLSGPSDGSGVSHADPIPLPQFRVFYAEKETLSTTIRNDIEDSALDIFNTAGRLSDPQSRKTVLQPGGQAKCGPEGGRLSVRPLSSPSEYHYRRREPSVDGARRTPSRPRTPTNALPRQVSSTGLRQTFLLGTPKPKRDGPLMIPRVDVKVTPLVPDGSAVPTEYAVRISLPAPSEADSEWLEFGLAQPSEPLSTGQADKKPISDASASNHTRPPPQVQVASASYEGVPVKFETSATVKPEGKLPALGLTFDETSPKEWMTWVKAHVGESGGGMMEVVYLVKIDSVLANGRKGKAAAVLNVLLPTFILPVGVMEVILETQNEFEVSSLQHNFSHQQTSPKGRTLTRYSLEEYFYPSLAVTIGPTAPPPTSTYIYVLAAIALALCAVSIAMALRVISTNQAIEAELAQAQQALDHYSTQLLNVPTPQPETLTVIATTTVYHTATVTQHLTVSSTTLPPPQNDPNAEATGTQSAETEAEPSVPPATSTPTHVPTVYHAPTPTPLDESALLPIRDMPFLFPIRFDISAFDIPDAARTTADVVMRGLGFAWQICRKVYHYPLDPP